MEGISEVQRKRKKTRPPEGGAAANSSARLLAPPLKTDVKACSCVWKKAFPWSGLPANGRGRQHLVEVGEGVPRSG